MPPRCLPCPSQQLLPVSYNISYKSTQPLLKNNPRPTPCPLVTHEKKIVTVSSWWAHRELTVTTVVTAPGPMITAQSRLGEVTAQSRRGHSSVMARSQLSHGEVTAQSRHLQYDHSSVTARSQLNHGPGHGSVTAGCDHFGHGELTVSSRWAVRVANFFSHGECSDCGDTSHGQGTNHPQAEHSPTGKWAVVHVTKRAISKQGVRQKNKHFHLVSLSWVTLTQLWTALFPTKTSKHLSDCTTEFLADTRTQTWSICYAETKT